MDAILIQTVHEYLLQNPFFAGVVCAVILVDVFAMGFALVMFIQAREAMKERRNGYTVGLETGTQIGGTETTQA